MKDHDGIPHPPIVTRKQSCARLEGGLDTTTGFSTPPQTRIKVPVCLHCASVICDKGREQLDSRFTRIVWRDIGGASSRGSTASYSHPSNSSPRIKEQDISLLSTDSGEGSTILPRPGATAVAGVSATRCLGLGLLIPSHTDTRARASTRARLSIKAPILPPSHEPSSPTPPGPVCAPTESHQRRNSTQNIQVKEGYSTQKTHLKVSGYFSQDSFLPPYIPRETYISTAHI